MAAPVLQRAMDGHRRPPGEIVDRAIRELADEGIAIRGASVMVVGVAYKPGVEDMRESPALEVLERLRASGANVRYTDALIPAVQLHDGVAMVSVADPASIETDLVIVHSMHPGVSHDWLAGRRVLDPSGRSKQAREGVTVGPVRQRGLTGRPPRSPSGRTRPAHRIPAAASPPTRPASSRRRRLTPRAPRLASRSAAGVPARMRERAPVDRQHVRDAQQLRRRARPRPGPS